MRIFKIVFSSKGNDDRHTDNSLIAKLNTGESMNGIFRLSIKPLTTARGPRTLIIERNVLEDFIQKSIKIGQEQPKFIRLGAEKLTITHNAGVNFTRSKQSPSKLSNTRIFAFVKLPEWYVQCTFLRCEKFDIRSKNVFLEFLQEKSRITFIV